MLFNLLSHLSSDVAVRSDMVLILIATGLVEFVVVHAWVLIAEYRK